MLIHLLFFFNDTATTEIYTLSLHDALPILMGLYLLGLSSILGAVNFVTTIILMRTPGMTMFRMPIFSWNILRSEEHTSELQSLAYLVCRLLLEKKKNISSPAHTVSVHSVNT